MLFDIDHMFGIVVDTSPLSLSSFPVILLFSQYVVGATVCRRCTGVGCQYQRRQSFVSIGNERRL